MDKPFKTYRQQLTILRGRNLVIKDGSKAIQILKNEGYYNIINGYKDIFLDMPQTKQYGDDRYKAGTTFEHIYALYNFDRNMRAILLKFILKMETSLKTKVAYYFSQTYKQNFNYLDINNFDSSNPQTATKLIADLSSVITKNTKKGALGDQFYHYLDKHKELPLWVLVTKMTLGNIIHFYNGMTMQTKLLVINEIISTYEKTYRVKLLLTPEQEEKFVSNMFAFINIFRNVCAHEERLYSITVKNNNKVPNIALFHKTLPSNFSSHFIDCVIILGLFLSKRDYAAMVGEFSAEIASFAKKLPQNMFNSVLIKMGFSKNWKDDFKLN